MSTIHLPPPLDRLSNTDLTVRTLQRGEALFLQNAPTGGLYYLVGGKIDLKRVTESGHSVLIHRARPGNTFAEASLFSARYHCSATAFVESEIVECRRSAVSACLESDIDFTRALAERFAAEIQAMRRRLELLSIREADERVMAAIDDGLLLDNITTFAELVGLSPETVYRSLAQLSDAGRIRKAGRGQYRALDPSCDE